MKRVCLIITMLICSVSVFADGLINAARKNDYAAFEKAVNAGAVTDEKDSLGMNLQVALGYFSDENFAKACKLLNDKGFDFNTQTESGLSLLYGLCCSGSEEKIRTLLEYNVDVQTQNKVNKLRPVDATQLFTYRYSTNQIKSEDDFRKGNEIRSMLIEKGSADPVEIEFTMKNTGNLFFCIGNVLTAAKPDASVQSLNVPEIFKSTIEHSQLMISLDYEKLPVILKKNGADVSFTEINDSSQFIPEIKKALASEGKVILIMNMGNNPVAANQWCTFKKMKSKKEEISAESYLKVTNSDALFKCIEFQLKDVKQIIKATLR